MAFMCRKTMLFNWLLLLCCCQCGSVVHSLVIIHPRLRTYPISAVQQQQQRQQIGDVTATTAGEHQQQDINSISDDSSSNTKRSSNHRRRWYGAEAKQMIRHLDHLRQRTEAVPQREAAAPEVASEMPMPNKGALSFFDKFVALFTDKPDDEGTKHDCFFSAFNCPVNPSRNIPGVRRVRLTADERQKLLANRHGTRHLRRARHRPF